MRPIEFFRRDVHSFWATAYQLDLKLFDQFLLRRLGNPPMNAVVLCDEESVTDTLLGLSELDMHVAANVNRRYLLRGMRVASGGRFHPKTYFFAGRRKTTLLVGSGNLTQTGLDRGLETFVQFDSDDGAHHGAFRAWAAWIGSLVADHEDPVLRSRFEHLLTLSPWLVGPSSSPEFTTNAAEPILDQLVRIRPGSVSELHVCAPFFDERAQALAALIGAVRPRVLHLYLRARTSVDGAAMRVVLDGAGCDVELHGFDPPDFVHAKLIGLIGADGESILLCGSPNISNAALRQIYTASDSRGNCEVAVLRTGDADLVRQAFHPPDHKLAALDLETIEEFEVEDEEPRGAAWPVRLRRAIMTSDERLQLEAEGELEHLRVTWHGAPDALALDTDARTANPLGPDDDALVIWLVDQEGRQQSNPVVVDDVRALDAMLGEGEARQDTPPELSDVDEESGLVELLKWAHRRFIFDVEDTPAYRRATNAQEQQQDAEDTDFWERYAQGELASDARSETYRPIGSTRRLTETDRLLNEIEAMLRAAPEDRRFRPVPGGREGEDGEPRHGQPWTFRARERVRARNLLTRWSRALGDPRQAWIARDAPAFNYEVMLEVLTQIWLGEALEDDDLVLLLGEVWTSLLGSNARRGFVDRADQDIAAEVLAAISNEARELGAGLAHCALHSDLQWTEWVYDWQPFLVRGLDAEVFRSGARAVELVAGIWGDDLSIEAVERGLHERAFWTDEKTWGDRLAEELDLSAVRFVHHTRHKGVSTVVEVTGMTDPSHDPRLIVIARRAMSFVSSDHVLIRAGEERFLLRLGTVCQALIDGDRRASAEPIDASRLAAIERQHGALAELIGSQAA